MIRIGSSWPTDGFVQLNSFYCYLCFQYAMPHLRKTKGNIINDSSLVGQIGQLGAVAYVSTKVSLVSSHDFVFTF